MHEEVTSAQQHQFCGKAAERTCLSTKSLDYVVLCDTEDYSICALQKIFL